jgi:hypothetical protein
MILDTRCAFIKYGGLAGMWPESNDGDKRQ